MNDTQDKMSNESSKGIEPIKLEWRSFGAHYKCDVANSISFWCFNSGENRFLMRIIKLGHAHLSIWNNSAKTLDEARELFATFNKEMAECGYNIDIWKEQALQKAGAGQ